MLDLCSQVKADELLYNPTSETSVIQLGVWKVLLVKL